MRYILSLLFCSWFSFAATARDTHAINAVAGDESFVQRFGRTPNLFDNPTLRVYTHLHWVEEQLRAVSTSGLTNDQRVHRAYLLDQLHAYTEAQRFPKNKKYKNENRPCFIDDEGSICAVGYLIEQSAGRSLSEKINARYQYDFIADMHDAELNNWIAWSGLSAKECALIQPEYEEWYSPNYEYGNDSLISYLQKHLNAPDTTEENSISFYVNAKGVPTDFQHTGNDAFAKRAEQVVKKLKFSPGGPAMMWNGGDDTTLMEQERKNHRVYLRFSGVAHQKDMANAVLLTKFQKADTSQHSVLIKGNVIDQYGQILPYCSVILKKGKEVIQYNSTDPSGNFYFTLDAYEPGLSLTVQYSGYRAQTFSPVPWNNQSLNIQITSLEYYSPYELSQIGRIRLLVK